MLPFADDAPEQARFALVTIERTPANQALYDALERLVDWCEGLEEQLADAIKQAEQAQAQTPVPTRKRKRKPADAGARSASPQE